MHRNNLRPFRLSEYAHWNPQPLATFAEPVMPLSENRQRVLIGAGLLLMAFVAYSPLWNAGFIWDDDDYVTENQTLRTADGLRRIWFEPRSIPQYYPLVHTTFWLEYQLWGLQPTGYHLVNVLLHGTSAILLWRLLLRLNVPGALLASALFALHPVMVESVAWVTERKNVLSLVLVLSSMLAYLHFAPAEVVGKKPAPSTTPWRYYALSLLLFVAALFSKTVVFSMPAVVLVIYWWKRGRITWQDVKPLLPFFAIGICLGAVTAWLEKHHVGAKGVDWTLTPIERVLLAGRVFWFYAAKVVWPYPLVFFYYRWEVNQAVWWQWLYPLAFFALLGTLYALRGRIGRGPLAAVLIYAGVLSPALGFFDVFPFRYSWVADHFQYHASIALITLAAAGLALLVSRVQISDRRAIVGASMALLLVCGVLTFRQARIYHDLETLYRDTLAKNPTARIAYNNLARYLARTNRTDEAVAVAREGLRCNPEAADMYGLVGVTLLMRGQQRGFQPGELDEAVEQLRTSIGLRNNDPDPFFNLANALSLQFRYEEALVSYQQALALAYQPDDVDALAGIVRMLIHLGRAAEARPYVERILKVDDQQPVARYGLGTILSQQGQLDLARRELQAALAAEPDLSDAHFELANVLMMQNEFPQAAAHYSECIRLNPLHVRAINNLGIAQMNLGQTAQAIENFSQAVQLAPDYAEARNNLQRAKEAQQPDEVEKSADSS